MYEVGIRKEYCMHLSMLKSYVYKYIVYAVCIIKHESIEYKCTQIFS